jgi:hypothetical protein
MFYRYNVIKMNSEDILYLYVDYNYEFASELGRINKKKNLVETVSEYIKNIDFNGKKIYIIASGIIMASLFLMKDNVLLNVKVGNPLNSNIATTEVYKKPDMANEKVEITNDIEIVNEEKIIEKTPEVVTPKASSPTITETKVATPKVVQEQQPITKSTTIPTVEKNVESNIESPIANELMITVYRSIGTVEQIAINDYLIGVVAAEMPASFNVEALKSQAIVARTYVLKRMTEGKIVTDTTSSQVYKDNGQLKIDSGRLSELKNVPLSEVARHKRHNYPKVFRA